MRGGARSGVHDDDGKAQPSVANLAFGPGRLRFPGQSFNSPILDPSRRCPRPPRPCARRTRRAPRRGCCGRRGQVRHGRRSQPVSVRARPSETLAAWRAPTGWESVPAKLGWRNLVTVPTSAAILPWASAALAEHPPSACRESNPEATPRSRRFAHCACRCRQGAHGEHPRSDPMLEPPQPFDWPRGRRPDVPLARTGAVAGAGFEPATSRLWASRATAAPSRCVTRKRPAADRRASLGCCPPRSRSRFRPNPPGRALHSECRGGSTELCRKGRRGDLPCPRAWSVYRRRPGVTPRSRVACPPTP